MAGSRLNDSVFVRERHLTGKSALTSPELWARLLPLGFRAGDIIAEVVDDSAPVEDFDPLAASEPEPSIPQLALPD